MKNLQRYFPLIVTVVLLAGLFTVSALNKKATALPQAHSGSTVLLTIPGIYSSQSINISNGETALDLLREVDRQDARLKLSIKDYPGMGTLVVSMAGQTNGSDGKYWTYYVNQQMAQVGADSYLLQNNDQIKWIFSGE